MLPNNTFLFSSIANLIGEMIANWDFAILERHWQEMTATLKSLLSDADAEARCNSRATLNIFRTRYPEKKAELFQVLDQAIQKVVLAERNATAIQPQGPTRDSIRDFISSRRVESIQRSSVTVRAPMRANIQSTDSLSSQLSNLSIAQAPIAANHPRAPNVMQAPASTPTTIPQLLLQCKNSDSRARYTAIKSLVDLSYSTDLNSVISQLDKYSRTLVEAYRDLRAKSKNEWEFF